MRKRWIGAATAVVVGIAVAGGLWKSQAAKAEAERQRSKQAAVPLEFAAAEVVKPTLAAMPLAIEFSGPLVAPNTAIVRAKAAGTLTRLVVAEGSRVRPGQSLGEIDLADLQTRVLDRSATVESAQANLAEAERQHAANVGLAAQNFISTTALQSSQAKLDAARAQLKSAQAQLAQTRVSMQEAALVAPIAGIVGKRQVVPGEKVSAEQPLVTIVDLSTLELVGTVGTHEVARLAPGQPVQVRVEGSAAPVVGRVDRIAPSAEAGTRSIGVVVKVDNRGEVFRAGQYAQARVEIPDDRQRMTLPSGALSQASGQDFVWTIEREALVRRIVVTGRRDAAAGRVEVLQGLQPEAQVLAVRFDKLREGAPARVVAQRPTGAPASAAAETRGPTTGS